ncbi:MAG: preprotein translocase subunit SecE [Opitutales bacterium]|nr:preprotein translocase subunit SecE [Opitutales bacterium]
MKFKIHTFCREMVEELKKTSWPNKVDLWRSTVKVLIAIVLLGLFVSAVDLSLFHVVDLLMCCVNR